MNKRLLTQLPIYLLLVAGAACQAQTEPEGRERVINTSGYGEVKVTPDRVVIQLTARATHSDGKAAKQDVDDQVNRFLAELKKFAIPRGDITASQLRIQPRYEYRSDASRFVGYEASRQVRVALAGLNQLTAIMDAGLNAGINNIDSIQYISSREEEHRREAHQLAIADSKAKARALARAYGAGLGPIVRIDYHNNQVFYAAASPDAVEAVETVAFKGRASQAGVYLPDEITFSDTIQVVFDLQVTSEGNAESKKTGD